MDCAKKTLNALLCFSYIQFCYSVTVVDTISINQTIVDGETLVSSGGSFALGFFGPLQSNSNRYLGIWYNKISVETVVWVANRDNPINDSSGVLSMNSNGNLVLNKRNQVNPLWSTNVSALPAGKDYVAQFLDSGNLVLIHSGQVVWQSFDYPTNTQLPNLKLGVDKRTGLNWSLTSWKSKDDPGSGKFSCRINPQGCPQLMLYQGQRPVWRGGHWNGIRWSGVTRMQHGVVLNSSFVNNEDEISITWRVIDSSWKRTVMVVNETGWLQRLTWDESGEGRWNMYWQAPEDECDNYERCGAFGNCDGSECTCLPGYQPKSPNNWELGDGSAGCFRNNQTASMCNNGEGFIEVKNVKPPDTSTARPMLNLDLKTCQDECLRNCSCKAYAILDVIKRSGCLIWYDDLLDTRVFIKGGQSLYVRVDARELAQYANKSKDLLQKKGILSLIILLPIAASFVCLLFSYCCLVKRRKSTSDRPPHMFSNGLTDFDNPPMEMELYKGGKIPNLIYFDIDTLAVATEDFSNKIGEGGFGSVYKGQLPNGQEIAVKILSNKQSGQGVQEFKNEVQLIAKLQHRNLVKLLGCCIHKQQKMLVYEYLPNKSLDFFIFDKTKKSLLDWRKRLEIICGIARGMLYLHQDSRLKIIHRDLKASNILLDTAMEPKISDFGIAKMFGEDQVEANTKRVVGTFGYMSPEYAMNGQYSIKSDVFSYGVLILEIISGRKNTGYDEEGPSLNLIGHVWDLWGEGEALEIVDSCLEMGDEILRCIQIGLLCVQESPSDRPTMPDVVFMLEKEIDVPSPRKPAFILRSHLQQNSLAGTQVCSINDITVSEVDGR